jgi:murein L,D-transpeptidase YafK
MTMLNRNILLKLLLLLALSSSLFSDILTQYRENGIQNLEKQMDLDLSKKEYWQKYLQNRDTKFGYLESYNNILACNKSKSTLSLYMKDKNNTYTLTKSYSAFTGKIKGDKLKEGDLKTPIGVYTLTKKLSEVDSFYGPMAFVTSYPNLYDKYKGKDGSGIWIHGLPMHQERDSFTKGCIAIKNASIKCLDQNIDINETVLIIKEKSHTVLDLKQKLTNVLSQLYAWRYAWIYNDTKKYLSFYDSAFKRFDGLNLRNFKKYKTRLFNKEESKTIIFKNINVIPYPNKKNTFKITFDELYNSNSFSFSGEKSLIVKLENSHLKIITEK